MTIAATILQDDLQAGGLRRNALIQYDDSIGPSSTTELTSRPAGEDLQSWADGEAAVREQSAADQELASNFEIVRNGGHSEDDVILERNTTAQWEEYLFKGMSNLLWGDGVADFAHVWTESQANQRARVATGLSTPQVVGWSGDAQPVAISRTQYFNSHTSDPVYTFPGFPTQ